MPNTPHKPHLIFDFGAVVFRWQPVHLFRQVLPQHAPSDDAARALADRMFKGFTGAWGRFDAGTIERAELLAALSVQAGIPVADCAAIVDAIPAHLVPLQDTVALIADLRRAGYRLFYLSNMPAGYADHLERHQPVLKAFEAGVFSARVQMTKPDPAIFRLALERFGVAGSDCIFFDDHPVNVEAARQLGIDGILFTDAAAARRELARRQVLGL